MISLYDQYLFVVKNFAKISYSQFYLNSSSIDQPKRYFSLHDGIQVSRCFDFNIFSF